MNTTRWKLISAALVTCLLGMSWAAHAQSAYPNRPIKLIAPFAPGGSTDALARLIAPEMAKRLGQPVVVDNRAGAGGTIGTGEIAKAEPDGYTIGLGAPGPLTVNVTLMDNLSYDPVRDFAPVAQIANLPVVLIAHKGVPANDVQALIALDKADPGKLVFASAGVGTTMHLAGEMLNSMAGTTLRHVAYKGTGLAINDILAGHVQLGFLDLPSAGPHVASGGVKILAVGNRNRALSAPNVPTIAESGVPGYETTGWFGIIAPAKTPPAIIQRLNAVLGEVMNTPDVRERLLKVGIEPMMTTPEEFAKFIRDEIPKWARVIESSGAKTKR